MKPAAFEYHAPDSVDEAVSLLGQHGDDAKLLAGGQSLIPTMNFRLAQPAVLVDLNRIPALDGIESTQGRVRIGAMTRQRAVERSGAVAELVPLLSETMPHIAHPQIRNRGTVGGSVAHADPAAELPAVVLALDATLHVRGRGGARALHARDFFTGLFATALDPEEVLVGVELPVQRPDEATAFVELSRRHGDYALVGVAVWVKVEGGVCRDARMALLSVGDGPVMADSAAALVRGHEPDGALVAAAAHEAATVDIDPPSDIHASARYRRHLASVLTRRALALAFRRAGETERRP